jgi:hypothetical protein
MNEFQRYIGEMSDEQWTCQSRKKSNLPNKETCGKEGGDEGAPTKCNKTPKFKVNHNCYTNHFNHQF